MNGEETPGSGGEKEAKEAERHFMCQLGTSTTSNKDKIGSILRIGADFNVALTQSRDEGLQATAAPPPPVHTLPKHSP